VEKKGSEFIEQLIQKLKEERVRKRRREIRKGELQRHKRDGGRLQRKRRSR
jgi:hypothetical protein